MGAVGPSGSTKPRRGPRRPVFRFVGREGGLLTWQRPLPGDSRVEQITADPDWFYSTMGGRRG